MPSPEQPIRSRAEETQPTPEAAAPAPAPGADNGTAPPAEATPPPGPPAPTAAEMAELKDKLLRALADAENTCRRSERDVADARQYAVTSFAREMLQVADNLRRALAAVP